MNSQAIIIEKEGNYPYQFKNQQINLNFIINQDCKLDFEFNNVKGTINYQINNCKVVINFFKKNKNNLNSKMSLKHSIVNINGLDLSSYSKTNEQIFIIQSHLNLIEKNYSKTKQIKKIKIRHQSKDSFSNLDYLGIGDQKAFFDFDVEVKINKNCDGAIANQKLKIIALNEQVKANLKPILKINHDQVKTNHATIFKKINDHDLYYLLIRGFSKKEAKDLIVKGNLLIDNSKYYQEVEAIL